MNFDQISDLKSLILQNKIAVISILVVLIGLLAGLILIRNPQILRSRAAGDKPTVIYTNSLLRGDTPENTTIIPTNTSHFQVIVDPADFPTN